jgi:hypothetical protein
MEPALRLVRLLEIFDRPPWLYRLRGAVPTGEQRFRPPRPVTDADLLGSMFRSDFVLGMAAGSMGRERLPGPVARLAWLSTMSKVVALAEAIGATRAENPEQGTAGSALRAGVDDLVAKMEERLGISLDFPDVGAAYGVVVGGRLMTSETPDQIYAAARLRDVIVDLPVVGVIQGYFLSQALATTTSRCTASRRRRSRSCPITRWHRCRCRSTSSPTRTSLPEIPAAAAAGYLRWAASACSGVFYSNNQESAAVFEGTPQNVVCELVAQAGGFSRVRRDTSALRRGYVEEVFVPRPGAPLGR